MACALQASKASLTEATARGTDHGRAPHSIERDLGRKVIFGGAKKMGGVPGTEPEL